MCSAASRGLSTCHSRSVASASSAAYSVALSISTQSNVILVLPAVVGAAGIDHIGHQHGVVIGRDLDAAHGKDLPIVFQILADLEDAFVLEQRLHGIEGRALGNLIGRDLALEQTAAAVAT